METIQAIPEWKAAADEIWAVLKESALRHAEIDRMIKENEKGFIELRESQKETERSLKETSRSLKEIDRIMKESALRQAERSAELDKKFDRLGVNVGGLNRSMGELIETLIAARLWEKFPEYGLVRAFQRVPIHDETNRVRTDIDILLSNTDKVMAVEVKRELDDKRDV
ncbi:MAG: hypothetical protein LBP76_12105, partial [Treponema sp.]|nr:hypothetical protein [Treponema sp.]